MLCHTKNLPRDRGGHDGVGTATVDGAAASAEPFLGAWVESELGVTFGSPDA